MLREGNRNWELSPPGPRQGLPSGTRSPGGSHMLRQVTRGQRSLTDSHITAVAEAETTKTRQSSFNVSAPGDAGSSPPHRLGFCTGRPRPRRWQAAFPHHRSPEWGEGMQGVTNCHSKTATSPSTLTSPAAPGVQVEGRFSSSSL